jgi:hypothetical protein
MIIAIYVLQRSKTYHDVLGILTQRVEKGQIWILSSRLNFQEASKLFLDYNSSFNSSNAVALETSCKRIATVLSYSFLLIISLSSRIDISVLRRMLTSSNSANALPVIFLSDLKLFGSLSKGLGLFLEIKSYLQLIVLIDII